MHESKTKTAHQEGQMFEAGNTNQSEALTKDELKKILRANPDLQEQLGVRNLTDFFAELDSDGDGMLSRDEWRAFVASKRNGTGTAPPADSNSELISPDQMFDAADADQSGALTKSELKKFLKANPNIKKQLGVGSWADLFAELDSDGDGMMSREEWHTFVISKRDATATAAASLEEKAAAKRRARLATRAAPAAPAPWLVKWSERRMAVYYHNPVNKTNAKNLREVAIAIAEAKKSVRPKSATFQKDSDMMEYWRAKKSSQKKKAIDRDLEGRRKAFRENPANSSVVTKTLTAAPGEPLGFTFGSADTYISLKIGVTSGSRRVLVGTGIPIKSVTMDGIADREGMAAGDLILSINGINSTTYDKATAAEAIKSARDLSPGSPVILVLKHFAEFDPVSEALSPARPATAPVRTVSASSSSPSRAEARALRQSQFDRRAKRAASKSAALAERVAAFDDPSKRHPLEGLVLYLEASAAFARLSLKEVFNSIDLDRSGKVTESEFAAGIKRLGFKGDADEMCRDFILLTDLDGDGEISYNEFKAGKAAAELQMKRRNEAEALALKKEAAERRLAARIAACSPLADKWFAEADRNGDGSLSRPELKKFLQAHTDIKERLGITKWATFFQLIDTDSDGAVSKDEWRRLVASSDGKFEASNSQDMQQGEVVTLSTSVEVVRVATSWKDSSNGGEGCIGSVDLDSGIACFRGDGTHWATCSYSDQSVHGGVISLNRDARSGCDGPEVITCKLVELPEEVVVAVCYIVVYNSDGTFASCRDLSISIDDVSGFAPDLANEAGYRDLGNAGVDLAKVTSHGMQSSKSGVLIAKFVRDQSNRRCWAFEALKSFVDEQVSGPSSEPMQKAFREETAKSV